jgi:hypothetical protein
MGPGGLLEGEPDTCASVVTSAVSCVGVLMVIVYALAAFAASLLAFSAAGHIPFVAALVAAPFAASACALGVAAWNAYGGSKGSVSEPGLVPGRTA